jgi:hypothetical protein
MSHNDSCDSPVREQLAGFDAGAHAAGAARALLGGGGHKDERAQLRPVALVRHLTPVRTGRASAAKSKRDAVTRELMHE